MSKVYHIGSADFEKEVLKSKNTVLVDFYADWCRPCQMIAPILDELAEEHADAKIAKVNIDHSPDLATKYKVHAIPTLVVIKEGKEVMRVEGLPNKQYLERMIAA